MPEILELEHCRRESAMVGADLELEVYLITPRVGSISWLGLGAVNEDFASIRMS
jgi:hypothetical protein